MEKFATSHSKRLLEICHIDDLDSDEIKKFILPNGHAVAVYKVEEQVFITDDICSHGEASLSEDGVIDGYTVECTWHFGKFDIRDGEPCAMPCEIPIQTWDSVVTEGVVYIEVNSEIV
ncbi:non-heme iron oxygenase ferredoxin subunit [Acinetobacter johnsonii]|uniref:non-heme iron oxygenase ferredoxin subunit n=1 Tax=Acinetobacter johnsonii TaxID=40214 RepID=UPI0024489471|nr:non-heme iron oxygenase ferredoxin subunit [Acinetobacter johnsonii]MDH1699648.1 non-heme iron oxygenase ferredoxin subunit [Acinetobacter johnsonii]